MRRRSGFGWIELISGLCMILLGIFTVFRPEGVLTWAAVIYGIIAIITGVCDILFYIKTERYTGFGPIVALIAGILSVMAGAILISHPGAGAWILTVLFPLWFIAHCISRLAHLNTIRFIAGKTFYYISMAINILGLILGIVMLFEPVFTIVTAAALIGAYLILSGAEAVAIAFSEIGGGW